jgi:hypothetical protein
LSVANEVVFTDNLDASCSYLTTPCDDSGTSTVLAADFFNLIGVSGPSLVSFTGTGTETFDVVFNALTDLMLCEGNFSETANCFADTFWGGDLSVASLSG